MRNKSPADKKPMGFKMAPGLLFGARNSFLEIEEKFLILQILQQKLCEIKSDIKSFDLSYNPLTFS